MRDLLMLVVVTLGCGDDGPPLDPRVPPADPTPSAQGLPPRDATPTSPECVAFCRRSIECAEREGRTVPPGLRDCTRACGREGAFRLLPATWRCGAEPCGPEFARCALEESIAAMRASDVPAFPPVCEGLCNKVGWCAERTGRLLESNERDCRTGCAPDGHYARLHDRFACVIEPCGEPLDRCLATPRP